MRTNSKVLTVHPKSKREELTSKGFSGVETSHFTRPHFRLVSVAAAVAVTLVVPATIMECSVTVSVVIQIIVSVLRYEF